MAKTRTSDEKPGEARNIAFRSPRDLTTRLDAVAVGLGLDVSNLVRMILYKHLHVYEEQVAEISHRKEKK